MFRNVTKVFGLVTVGLLLGGCAVAPQPGHWVSMYPGDHEPDRLECVSQSVGQKREPGPISVESHCSSWVGDRYVSSHCSSWVSGDTRSSGLLNDDFIDCMAGRGHFHYGSAYNLAQPAAPGPWMCNDAPGIDCTALARAHEIRTKERRGETLSGEDRQFLYDRQIERIRERQRALGMIE